MSSAALAHARLLVAEENPDFLAVVQSVLEEEGCTITPAASLPASLTLLREQVFHLVLTGLFYQQAGPLPLQNIQPLLTQASPIPVGVITGWNVDASAALQAGASFLLRKPFNLADLLQAVQQELSSQSGLERQQALVQQFFAASAAGDWPRLARLCTPDLTVVPLGAPPLATLQGPRGLLVARPLLKRRFHTLPGFTIEEVLVYARPQGVAARYTASWQSRDGVLHYIAGSMRFHFAGGRIAQIEGSFS